MLFIYKNMLILEKLSQLCYKLFLINIGYKLKRVCELNLQRILTCTTLYESIKYENFKLFYIIVILYSKFFKISTVKV